MPPEYEYSEIAQTAKRWGMPSGRLQGLRETRRGSAAEHQADDAAAAVMAEMTVALARHCSRPGRVST
ncbi:hypothetical protein GCM10023193_00930 [Planotetraspora kaengkrachanensis]|uniref:Uncharacterized protein n=1 Tax=Planotetraspora kaengkrachanensis TaxID=575193 RepID=A0A8J3LTC7_9ACTN|nr:hypothetical protein Pka01_04660 [Planotetraspora kaengkrachanensis]